MTSGKSFWDNFIKNNTQRLWMWIVSILSFIIAYPAFLIAYFNRVEYVYGGEFAIYNRTQYIKEMREAVCDCLGYNSALLHFGLAGLLAIGIFSYLNNRSKMDMLKSVPVSSRKMYINDYVNGFVIYVIPYLISLIIAVIIAACSGFMTGLAAGEMLIATIFNIVIFLIYYSLAVVCVCITGNIFISVCAYLSLSLSFAILHDTIDSFAGVFFKTKSWEFVANDYYLSPIIDYETYTATLKSLNDIGKELKILWSRGIIWLIMAIVMIGLAYFAYQKRPTEALNKVVYSRKIQLAAKIFLGIIGTISAASLVFNGSGESKGLLILVLIIGGSIIGMAFEAIFAADIKAAIKSLWSTGIIVVAGMCIFLYFQFDILGYDRYVPNVSSIESYAIDMSPNIYVDVFEFRNNSSGKVDTSYMNCTDYYEEYMNIHNVEAIAKLAQKCADEKLYLRENDDNIRSYCVLYRKKGFGKLARRVYVDIDDKESQELLNEIVSSREWKTGYFQILNEKDNISQLDVKITYKDGVHAFVMNSSAEAVIEAFDKDIDKFDYYLGSEETPVGMVYIDFDMGNCYSLPVYASYTNLMALAQKCDGYTDVPLTAEDVESIRITNYHSEFWEGDTSNIAYDYTPEVTVVVTDKDKIQEILDCSTPSILIKFWDRYNQKLGNYTADIFLAADKGEYRRGEYISRYFSREIPGWLEQETASQE